MWDTGGWICRHRPCPWSEGVYRIHGLDPESFVPQLETAIDLYHPEDREVVKGCVADAIERRSSYEFTLRIVRPDGDVRHVLSRGRCEVDAASDRVTGLFGIFMDVTDLARVERQLGDKSANLEATLDSMDQGPRQGGRRRVDRAGEPPVRGHL